MKINFVFNNIFFEKKNVWQLNKEQKKKSIVNHKRK